MTERERWIKAEREALEERVSGLRCRERITTRSWRVIITLDGYEETLRDAMAFADAHPLVGKDAMEWIETPCNHCGKPNRQLIPKP